jgi:hypothetical protein
MIFDPREAIMDDILGHDHVSLTIFYYLGNISVVMTIWKWSLAHTNMEGLSLKELLFSYNESYIPKVDVRGMIGVKKKKYGFNKRKRKEIVSINFILRIKKVLSEESCCGIKVAMCCLLNCCQHFPRQMIGILRHEFWNKLFEERFAHTLDIPRRFHRRGDCNCAKFVMF